jgi:hypothetical protein
LKGRIWEEEFYLAIEKGKEEKIGNHCKTDVK